METSQQLDQEIYNDQPSNGIPVFLKVLCILTFVGSGLGLIGALWGFVASGYTEESLRISQSLTQSQGLGNIFNIDFEEMIRWTRYSNIANLIGSALCLTGALMMWKLKKIGYFLYIPGWIIPLVVGFIAMQHMLGGGMFASLGIAGQVLNVFIAAAFIIMYGLNFKHLK